MEWQKALWIRTELSGEKPWSGATQHAAGQDTIALEATHYTYPWLILALVTQTFLTSSLSCALNWQ